ncbi:MAG: response regulator [Candidatus Omnitrophota bacterium]|nr:response regulator [Candidatus Omnitrophota bacterium]
MDIPNILVVDDELEIHNTIKSFLNERIESNIYKAQNGEEALEVLKKLVCDIMILDIRMPKKNGLHVLDEMKTVAGGDVEAIVITAWDSDLVAEECVKRNVECIPKPVILTELYDKVIKILQKKNKCFFRKAKG